MIKLYKVSYHHPGSIYAKGLNRKCILYSDTSRIEISKLQIKEEHVYQKITYKIGQKTRRTFFEQ